MIPGYITCHCYMPIKLGQVKSSLVEYKSQPENESRTVIHRTMKIMKNDKMEKIEIIV